MHGLYKVVLTTKNGQERWETVLDYFATTLFCGIDHLADEIDTAEYYAALGSWARNVFDKFLGDTFEVVFEMDNDCLTRYWFIDENNTIKQEFVGDQNR